MVKETRTKILLSLILFSENFFSRVKFNQRLQQIFDISWNEKTKGIISGLIKEGLIEKEIDQKSSDEPTITDIIQEFVKEEPKINVANNEPLSYRLTFKGFYRICLEFPFFRFLKDSWDGRWRIISYEIPETKREIRDRLRREMQGWGLGPWHRSFWLTPHPIIENLKELIGGKEEEKYFQAFEASHAFGNQQLLIEKVWQKSQLDRNYRQLFKKWHDVLSSTDDKLFKLKKVVNDYVDFLKNDPGLPKELLGETWIGFEAWVIFKEIKAILLN